MGSRKRIEKLERSSAFHSRESLQVLWYVEVEKSGTIKGHVVGPLEFPEYVKWHPLEEERVRRSQDPTYHAKITFETVVGLKCDRRDCPWHGNPASGPFS